MYAFQNILVKFRRRVVQSKNNEHLKRSPQELYIDF